MTFSVSYVIILPDMRDITETMKDTIEKKKLVCDMCDREDGAKSEWEGTIKVREWGNPYDHGIICDECQETVNESA